MADAADNLFWDQLLQLIAEERVVPVVGRDLLIVRYKGREERLYPLVAKRLAEYLQVAGGELPVGGEIYTVVCRYLELGNRIEDVYAALKIVMPDTDELSIPEPLAKLAAIHPFKLFVTTTFDPLLVRAINQARFDGVSKTRVLSYTPNAVEDLPGPVGTLDRPTVYYLFGRLSAIPAYAVTEEDILEFLHSLQSASHHPHLLLDELNRANLLILGCGFEDWLARFFMRATKRQRLMGATGGTDYVADAQINNDASLVLFLRRFSTRTKIYEGGGGLQFIDELHRRWTARYPQGSPDEGVGFGTFSPAEALIPGIVFLSYASEDRSAAAKIKDALEAVGVDVFFDKDDLRAGDDFEAKLRRAISESSLFLPVISQNTLTRRRRFFRIEWNQALEEALKVAPSERYIIPVVIDATPPTEPGVPERFRKLHWEALPDGQVIPKFVNMIKDLYRKYQKSVVGLSDGR